MIIEKTKGGYTATGEGLVATGRTHYEALSRLLAEIFDMRRFENQIFGLTY